MEENNKAYPILTIPRSDDEFTDLFGAVLIITLSVINTDSSDLDYDINSVAVHQADHGDMLFQAGQLRINNTATEYIDSYGVLGYMRNLLGMMPDAKKSRWSVKGDLKTTPEVVIMAPTLLMKS